MVSAISDNSKVLPRLQLAVLEQEEVEKMQTLKFKLNPSGRKRRTLLNMMVTQTSLIDKVLSKLLLDEINGDLSRATAFNIQKRFSTKKSPEYVGNDFKQAFVESAVIKASQSWISYTSRKYPIDKETGDPQNILINEPMLYLRTRQVEFLKTERGSYVVGIRLPKGKIGETLVIPTDGHQYDGTIEEIMNATDRWSEKNANEFTAEIKTYGDDIYLNVMCDFKKPVIDYEPENMIGVDIGQVNIATIAVISKDENLQKAKFFNGRKIYRLIDRMEHRNDKLKSNDKEPTNVSEFKKTVSHQVSRAVIEFAKTFPKPIIVAEDLKNMPRGDSAGG
jgi:transposase